MSPYTSPSGEALSREKHHPGYSVLVEQELVNRVEPMENREQGDEVEEPAVGIPDSSVPRQQEESAADGEPG